jgi:hypothetical protein
LIGADARTATVKGIALEHGFYQMGRFAIRYKALFGKSPSESLQQPPVAPAGCLGLGNGSEPRLPRRPSARL